MFTLPSPPLSGGHLHDAPEVPLAALEGYLRGQAHQPLQPVRLHLLRHLGKEREGGGPQKQRHKANTHTEMALMYGGDGLKQIRAFRVFYFYHQGTIILLNNKIKAAGNELAR